MPKRTWTKADLKKLKKLLDKGEEWKDIAEKLGKTVPSVKRKVSRMNMQEFDENIDNFGASPKPWTQREMAQLDAFLQADNCSYRFIAEKLGRSITSVERQAQETDWKAWRAIAETVEAEGMSEADRAVLLEQMVDALLTVTRYNFQRLNLISEEQFLTRVNLDKDKLFIEFDELKEKAAESLASLGFGNPETLNLGPGRYVIVGDSHGKHTKKEMFALLRNINKTLKPDKIIHIGHILDDDNDISYEWGQFDNLVVLAKIEELKVIQDQRNKFKFNYEVVREHIEAGDLFIFNQDMISDYVKTPISNLDTEIFDDKLVVNCHRLEFFSRNSYDGNAYLSSPGCLCENHIIKTIKQIDFTDGRIVKQAFWDGFVKYRKMRHTNKYWERGMLVVEVNKKKEHTIIPCQIKKTSKGFTTAYFDKIITSKGVFKPSNKILINADMHCDKHDTKVLDIIEQIAKDYAPHAHVNLGDTLNYHSLNHHVMDRGVPIVDKKILDEAAVTHFVMKRLSEWAKDSYLIYGNHERFAQDFVNKYPQFGNYLDFNFLCSLEQLGYKLIDLQDVLEIGNSKYIHGELRMYGQPGSKLEKASRTFGDNTFVGHIHYPCMRFGCCSIGLSGELDQEYNEPNASQWIHGLGMCNQFDGESFITTICIVKNRCNIGGKTYVPKAQKSWKPSSYKAEINYAFK